MSSTRSELRPRGSLSLAAGAVLLLLAMGCAHLPAPAAPRPPLPLPPALAARYALPGDVVEEVLVPTGGQEAVAFYRARLRSGNEHADFHYLVPQAPGPHPFVLCLPILAGGRELMWIVAQGLTSRGYAVAWTERVASALRSPQRGPELELLFRRTLLHNRMVLAWARTQPQLDPSRMACVGISLGSMVGGVLLALEPDLRAGALCLSGGDLPALLLESAESRVIEWREWRRRTDGIQGAELEREIRTWLATDPARFGPYVAAERVLLVGGTFDTVVPPHYLDILWESLGRPERRFVPLGHYTAALALGPILGSVDTFFQTRMAGGLARPVPRP